MRSKRFFRIELVILFSLFGVSLSLAHTTANLSFPQADLTISAEKGFDVVTLSRCSSSGEVGKPQLPVRGVSLVVPPDVRVTGVKVLSFKRVKLAGCYNVIPAQPIIPLGETAPWVEPDERIYNSLSPYPGKLAEITGDGYMGGYHIANLLVYPVEHIPARKELYLYTEINLEVEYQGTTRDYVKPFRMSLDNQKVYKRAVKELVENPTDVKMCASFIRTTNGKKGRLDIKGSPSQEGSPVEYVIITNDEMASAFRQLADWKIRKGTPAVVKTISWIEANYPHGCDLAETIRNFIKDAYQNWGTIWVLLGGDTEIIPVRLASTTIPGSNLIPCDLYYSDLDGNWNCDGDAWFGEADEDSLDLYPEVFVGRAPVHNPTEASNFIQKLFTYEKDSQYSDYQTKLLLLGQNMGYYTGDGGELCNRVTTPVPGNFTRERLYESLGNEDRESVIAAINEGYSFIFVSGHGIYDNIGVRRVPREYIYNQDMDGLTNHNRYSIMYAMSCHTNAIDHDCISEHFINCPNGGGVGYIGSTKYDLPFVTPNINLEFFQAIFTDNFPQVGKANAFSKLPLIPYTYSHDYSLWEVLLAYLLLGDPQMEVWTATPKSFVVSHPTGIPIGPGSFTVTVRKLVTPDPYPPVDSALVCLYKGGEVYATGYTNTSGEVTLSVTPETWGPLSVVVTKQNFFPYEGSANAWLPSGEIYLSYEWSGIDDSGGNGNGRIEGGEQIGLSLMLSYQGEGPEPPDWVEAILSTQDSLVTIQDSLQDFSPFGPDLLLSEGKYHLTTSPSCPDGHKVGFILEISCFDPPFFGSDTFQLTIHSPWVEHTGHIVEGGKKGIVELPVTLRNSGTGDAEEVIATLGCSDPEVIILDGLEEFGSIPAGSEVTCTESPFCFILPPGKEQNPILFTLSVTDSYERNWEHTFNLYAPSSPESLAYMPGRTSIELRWRPNPEPDIEGYNVYRGDSPEGDFQKVNRDLIKGVSYYYDEGLEGDSRYYYKVTAVDQSANESPPSEVFPVATNPSYQAGWPVEKVELSFSSPAVVDLDKDGKKEVLIATIDNRVWCWRYDGSPYLNEGIFALGDALGDDTAAFWASPAVGDIDEDGKLEVILASAGSDHKIYAWNAEDGSGVSGWPVSIDSSGMIASPVIGDLDGDGNLEIVCAAKNGIVYAWNADGSGFLNQDGIFALMGGEYNYATPGLADLDGDGKLEVVLVGREGKVYAWHPWTAGKSPNAEPVDGFPVYFGDRWNDRLSASPAIGDVDPMYPGLEIVVMTDGGIVHLLHSDGTEAATNWPVSPNYRFINDIPASPAIADVDGDGSLDIVSAINDKVYVFDNNGEPHPGWPRQRAINVVSLNSSPLAVDLDGDGGREVLAASADERLYGWHADGSQVLGWPVVAEWYLSSTPVVADLDGDGDVEVIYSAHDKIFCWDCSGSYNEDGMEWPMFHHDLWRTGLYGFNPPVVGTPEEEERATLPKSFSLFQNYPNPFNPLTQIRYALPVDCKVKLEIYNILGQRVVTLIDGKQKAGYKTAKWDASSFSSGIYFYRLEVKGDRLKVIKTRKMILLR